MVPGSCIRPALRVLAGLSPLLAALVMGLMGLPASGQERGTAALGATSEAAAAGTVPVTAPVPPQQITDEVTADDVSDLSDWRLWWQHNQAPYLALKEHVQSIGTASERASWFLGDGQRPQPDTLRPTQEQVRGEVVPALLALLQKEDSNEIVVAAMLSLAKIGDGGDATNAAQIEAALTPFIHSGNQAIREKAVIAVGVLASPRSIPLLSHLMWDT